jgi:spore coat protein U-like protein
MKHRIVLALAAAGAFMLGGPARAATAQNNFNVSITLNSACQVVTVPTIAFTYTSFQPGNATSNSSFTIQCTNTKAISSVLLDDGAGGLAAGLSQGYVDQATGLAYTLTLSGVPAAGTGATQTINIAGTMASGQSGSCNAASCTNAASTNKTRTITITY